MDFGNCENKILELVRGTSISFVTFVTAAYYKFVLFICGVIQPMDSALSYAG
jgi:hypothetical protein